MPTCVALAAALLSLLLSGTAGGQRPAGGSGLITGLVRAGDDAPVLAAAIALRRSTDTALVAASATDSAGAFRLTGVGPGSYRVDVRRIGYATVTRSGVTVGAGGGPVDLGIIRLTPIATELQNVVVSSARATVTVLPDRNVYSTSNMPTAAGGMATDVLRGIPELQVSAEGTVTTRGATPRIYINGRPAPMQGESLDRYLLQLPAERIDRVEVISNPGARYEADGQGGIVNIVMKRGTGVGISGSVAANAGTRNQQGGSGSLNFQKGRLSIFASASASFFGTTSRNTDLRQNLNVQPATFIRQDSRSRNSGDASNGSLAAELQVGPRGTLWGDLNAGRTPSRLEALVAYTHLDQLSNPTQRYDRLNDTERRGRFGSFAAGYRNTAKTGAGEWSVELRRNVNLSDYADESARRLLDQNGAALDILPVLTIAGQGQSQHGVSLDANLSRRWGESGQVEAGYRGSLRRTGDDFQTAIDSAGDAGAEASAVGDFRQRERIDAGYGSVSRKIGRVNVQAGLRGEQAQVRRSLPLTGEVFASTYRNLFPSALVSTEFGTGGQVSLSYARRVDRPWGAVLNPAVPILDPLNRRIGNPLLMPRYTDAFSVSLSRTGRLGMLQFSPYCTRTVDSWDQIRTVDTAGVSTVTWQNLATVSTYGGSVSASLIAKGRVSGLLNVSAYREVRNARNLQPDFSGASTQLSAISSVSVRATPALSLEGFATYMPARNVPQGRVSAIVFSTLGARRQLSGRRGALTLSVVDPFKLERFTFTTRDRAHVQVGSSTYSARRATLGVSYSFGRQVQRKARRNGDEDQRENDTRAIR